MATLRKSVFVLFVLLESVSCEEVFFTDTVNCYFLDAFLMFWCILGTILFCREKILNFRAYKAALKQKKPDIYQELERPKDTDLYQVLEPVKKVKKDAKRKKKKKSQLNSSVQKEKDENGSSSVSTKPPVPTSP